MAKAGVISIDINAGTAQFLADMDTANVKLQQFGRGAQESGIHVVTSMQASSAAIRLLENPMGNNIRAVERFIGLLPGMGKALQLAFPVVGALAFGDLLVKLGGEAVKFFKDIEQAPQRIANAFHEINAPLRLTNDELALANDRLRNQFAKLEGKQENGGAIALDEMRVNADKLAESLDKDLAGLEKLLKENKIGLFQSIVSSSRQTEDDADIKKFRERVGVVTAAGSDKIRAAKTPEEGRAAQSELNVAVEKLYNDELERRNKILKDARTIQDYREGKAIPPDEQKRRDAFAKDGMRDPRSFYSPTLRYDDQSNFISQQSKTIQQLKEEKDKIKLLTDNSTLEGSNAVATKARTEAEQTAQIRLAEISNQEKTNAQFAALSRQKAEAEIASQHAIRQAAIDAMPDARDRAVASAAEEIQVAKDKAVKLGEIDRQEFERRKALLDARIAPESVGKTDLQKRAVQTRITGPGGEVDQATQESTAKALSLFTAVEQAQDKFAEAVAVRNREGGEQSANAWREAYDGIMKAARETSDAQAADAERVIQANLRALEIKDKSKGELDSLNVAARRIDLERQYGLEVTHSREQELAFTTEIARLEDQQRTAKLTGLAAELHDAMSVDEKAKDYEKIANLQAEIGRLGGEGRNASARDQAGIDVTRKSETLPSMIQSRFGDGSPFDKSKVAVADSLANGVNGIAQAFARAAVETGKFGRAFAQIGKQLAISALTDVLKIGLQQVLAGLLRLVPAFGTVAAAQAAAAATAKGTTSAVDVGEAEGNAAVAATGAAAAVAWIPIVGPALAAGAAASMYASLQPYVALAAFETGTAYVPSTGVAMIHKGERIIDAQSNTVIADALASMSAPLPGSTPGPGGGDISHSGNHTFNIYEAGNGRTTARQVATLLKSQGLGIVAASR